MGVTTREALHAFIDRLSDEEREELFELLELNDWERSPEEELSPSAEEGMLEGRRQHERGESVDGGKLFEKLGL